MLQHHQLDAVFHALADPTRRAMVERLAAGPSSVSDLAAPFPMSLSAIGQHVQLLEASGLVRTAKEGRVRRVELVPAALSAAERWFRDHRARWERRLDRLGQLLADEDDGDAAPTPSPAPPRVQAGRGRRTRAPIEPGAPIDPHAPIDRRAPIDPRAPPEPRAPTRPRSRTTPTTPRRRR